MEGARAKGIGLSLAESNADWLDEEDEWLEEDDSELRQHRVKRNLPRETVYTGAREVLPPSQNPNPIFPTSPKFLVLFPKIITCAIPEVAQVPERPIHLSGSIRLRTAFSNRS
jgi:hypothetical protein